MNLRTQNPARAVAISGVVIVALILTAVGMSVWRFNAAENSYGRVTTESSQNLRVVGRLRQNILDRQAAVITFYSQGDPAQVAKLAPLERQFDAQVVNALRIHETIGSTPAKLRELRRLNRTVIRLGNELEAAANPHPNLGPVNKATRALEQGITGYSDAEGRELAVLGASARHDARAARLFAITAGLVAALLTALMVLYITTVLRDLLRRVRRSASTLTIAVADMRAAAQESASALAEQSAAVAEVAATADELSSTASAIAAGAETMSSAAQQTTVTVEDMREQASTIAQRSLELGRSSEEIGEILTLLTDIAERTDLLALNAAIEAAHAGDAGRGFAVVATEIRKLAESSGRSTKSIQDVVARVQDTSGATILAAERGTVQSDEIAERMLRSTADLEDSRQAAEQQRAAAEQVAGALSGIRGAVQKLSGEEKARVATTQQVEDLTGDLTRLLEAHGITLNGHAPAETAA